MSEATAEQKIKALNLRRPLNIVPDTKIRADVKQLGQCYVMDENEIVTLMSDLWKQSPAVIVFLRHFACEACRVHATEVWKNRSLYESKGAKIYFVGNGTPHFMKSFKNSNNLSDAQVFTDPSLRTFDAAGFKRGFWIDPGNMHTRPEFITKAIMHNLKKTGSGNVWQLGGIVVVKPNGTVSYQYTSQTMDDHPPGKDVAT